MVQTTLYVNFLSNDIPPDGTLYFTLGPGNFKGAVTVTAHAVTGIELPTRYMEVIQLATRTVGTLSPGEPPHILDIVVRNNSHKHDGTAAEIEGFYIYTSVIS
jgi:hypothetical protein